MFRLRYNKNLITGVRDVGKTTLVQKLVPLLSTPPTSPSSPTLTPSAFEPADNISNVPVSPTIAGFFTEAITAPKQGRVGFRVRSWHQPESNHMLLAHVGPDELPHIDRDEYKCGNDNRWKVDVPAFDAFLESLHIMDNDTVQIVVLDEINQLALLSQQYAELIRQVLNSDIKQCLLTMPLIRADPLFKELKQRGDVYFHFPSEANRDRRMLKDILVPTNDETANDEGKWYPYNVTTRMGKPSLF